MDSKNLNTADKEKRIQAYDAVQQELKFAQTSCKNILMLSRKLPSYTHTGERTKIKNTQTKS